MIAFTDEQLALIRRRRNEGDGVDDTIVELRTLGVNATREDVLQALRIAPPLGARTRTGTVHRTEGAQLAVQPGVLASRDVRSAAYDARDLTAMLMGDPPRGFSALDQRRAKETHHG